MSIRLRLTIFVLILLALPSLALAAKSHKVKKNETLSSIARKYHVRVADLKAANNLANTRVKPGTILVVPPRSEAAAAEPVAEVATYKVRKGDTLIRIARKTGVSVNDLRQLNNLGKKRVKPGQVLALRAVADEEQPARKLALKKPLKSLDIYNESEYERSLAELVGESGEDTQADFTKGVTLGGDGVTELKKTGYSFIGTRYRFGGTTRKGLDCSSFVQHVFRELDVTLPRTAREQFHVGNPVATGDLQKGDLLFFHTYARFPSHVGIYLGNNKMIHASSRDRRVVISSIDTPYYRSRFIGAKRISQINPDVLTLDDLLTGVEEEGIEDILANDTLGVGLLK
ncbi:peptidoglycan-binding protein LysM [Geobacter sulfurreducens]|nr:peptidoglycan-binding protein LysM [Geobacter sulfurreducens]